MRVLLTTDTIGGVWTYTKELTEGLLERGHAVALVSFGRPPSDSQSAWCGEMYFRYNERFLYAATEIPLEWMENNESSYIGAEALLLTIAGDFKADLLHSNQFCFGRLPASMPRVVVAHSDVLSWAAACKPSGLPQSPWLDCYKQLVQAGLLAADAVVAPTRWMLQALAGGFALPSETHVISNGRDVFSTSTHTMRHLRGVTVGRVWDKAKGIALLEEIQSPFPLFIAGEVQHGNEIASKSLGGATVMGLLSDDSLLDLFRSSSIYLALSIYEPFGLAPLEAALCGCAVIARNIPSLREVWADAALYFEDAHELTALLAKLSSSTELLQEFQNRALQRARQLSRSRMTELYVELYRHLLEPNDPLSSGLPPAEVLSHAS